ncbi:jg3642 [Pararge aegeria aegeria]|uniref:Jg3642 protein n=1 Tax=Pararge aegeria aegeria TaxID=348720 RepID=A0A8S4QFX2_9NEOP|nr:jg3642 [Pararge aegeria aegeria]
MHLIQYLFFTHPPSHVLLIFVTEIVEEQRCHDYEFRLTCRDLDTHIAVLDAWYIAGEDYHRPSNDTPTHASMISTENDSELDRVFVYSSPKHNGVYELTNHSIIENSENFTASNMSYTGVNLTELTVNDSLSFNDTFDSVDMSVEFVNASEGCGVETFARSYASWHEGDKRRRPVSRASAMNLRAPLSYR